MHTYLVYMCIVSLAVIIGMSGVMILWPRYNDGIFGKFVLIALSIASFAELERCYLHLDYQNVAVSHAWLYTSIALLQVRHFWRFVRYTYYRKCLWAPKVERRMSAGRTGG